jgi:hypothetical protein
MRMIRWAVACTLLTVLIIAVPSQVLAFCLTLTNGTGTIVDAYEFQITGINGSFVTLAMLETTRGQAAMGSVVVSGGTLLIGVTRPSGLAIVTDSCSVALATLTGGCAEQVVFPNPANGANGTFNRAAVLSGASCP